MDDAIADGVGDGRVGEEVVPAIVFELARDDRRAKVVAVFEDLEQVAPRLFGQRSDREVVEDEDIDLGNAREETGVRSVGASEAELVEEPGDASVEYTESLAAGLMRERAREVALPGARRAGDDDGLVLDDPSACRQPSNDRLVELSLAREVDAFDARLADAKLRVAEILREAGVNAPAG
ncbi:MAG: hypothetical protein U0270_20065 [Labilithrix sp.]